MRKQILKHRKMKMTFIPKIILHNYILYKSDPTYVETFTVNLRMVLIFTDLQQEVGLHHVLCWKSVNIRGIPESTGKVPT